MTNYNMPVMEYMVTDVCTLSCDYCTNYSNYRTKGLNSWATAQREVQAWLDRGVTFEKFSLIGGEPTSNPDIVDYIYGLRSILPHATIQLVTNGTVSKHLPKILTALDTVGNFILHLTVHLPREDFYKTFKLQVLDMPVNWTPMHNKLDWLDECYTASDGSLFEIDIPKAFLSTYKGQLSNMKPYHNDPDTAFDICIQQDCPLMYQGRLYKCSTSGLLKRTLIDHNLQHDSDWAPYINYQGIGPDCSDEELTLYCDNFGKPLNICSMCPSQTDRPWKSHIVKWKKEIK
jgi:hypothetical protein